MTYPLLVRIFFEHRVQKRQEIFAGASFAYMSATLPVATSNWGIKVPVGTLGSEFRITRSGHSTYLAIGYCYLRG
jgi:hypothetical protein